MTGNSGLFQNTKGARIDRDTKDCVNCKHAHKVAEHEWECDAENYDIKNLTCFVPRDEE